VQFSYNSSIVHLMTMEFSWIIQNR